MYARSTTLRGNPQSLDDGIAYIRDEVMPLVQGMDGCVGLSMLCDRDSGRCIVTTAWESEDAMRASAEAVRDSRARAGEIFGDVSPEVREWEIALMHRLHEAPEGACSRVTWAQGDPDNAERMIDTFRMGVLPKLDALTGFCSVSVLVDRGTGMTVIAAAYASREALEQSSRPVMDMRDQFTREMRLQTTDMAEFELVLAHLRVPETV